MAHSEIIAGLDIGTTKTCCVLAEVDLDTETIDIIGVGMAPSDGLKKGVVVDLEAATASIQSATSKAQQMAGSVSLRSVWVGVTGEHISSLNSRGVVAITSSDREVTDADVDRAIEQSKVIVLPPDREIVQSIPRGYVVDGQDSVRDPVGMSAGRLEVETHIITGSTSFLDNVKKCVERAGLAIEGRVFEPIATAEAAVFPAEKDLGVALADIGGGTTDIAVFINGEIFHSAVLPIGGQFVTRDIAMGLRTAQYEAERTKIAYGCASSDMVDVDEIFTITTIGETQIRELPREILVGIIEPRMQEILQMIKAELMRSGKLDLLPAGVVLTGGGAQMPGTAELAQQVLELPVRIGRPEGVRGLNDTVETPMHATAVGLVRYAAKNHAIWHDEQKTSTIKHGLKAWIAKLFK